MNEGSGCLIDQGHVIEGLHFGGQITQQGGLDLIGEELQALHDDRDKLLHGNSLLSKYYCVVDEETSAL